jgi:hypothetical protein
MGTPRQRAGWPIAAAVLPIAALLGALAVSACGTSSRGVASPSLSASVSASPSLSASAAPAATPVPLATFSDKDYNISLEYPGSYRLQERHVTKDGTLYVFFRRTGDLIVLSANKLIAVAKDDPATYSWPASAKWIDTLLESRARQGIRRCSEEYTTFANAVSGAGVSVEYYGTWDGTREYFRETYLQTSNGSVEIAFLGPATHAARVRPELVRLVDSYMEPDAPTERADISTVEIPEVGVALQVPSTWDTEEVAGSKGASAARFIDETGPGTRRLGEVHGLLWAQTLDPVCSPEELRRSVRRNTGAIYRTERREIQKLGWKPEKAANLQILNLRHGFRYSVDLECLVDGTRCSVRSYHTVYGDRGVSLVVSTPTKSWRWRRLIFDAVANSITVGPVGKAPEVPRGGVAAPASTPEAAPMPQTPTTPSTTF